MENAVTQQTTLCNQLSDSILAVMKLLRTKFVCLLAVALLALAGCSSSTKTVRPAGLPKTKSDSMNKRRIVMSFAHTEEKLDIIYYHDGKYDERAMEKISRLMRDHRTGEAQPIAPELIDFMVDLRSRLSLPATLNFEILSGYRSPATNAMLAKHNKNVAKESLHMRGIAVDFHVEGLYGSAMAEIAKTMQRGGVSYYPSSKHVHIDVGNIRSWGYQPGN